MRDDPPGPPPTIASLRALGVKGITVWCASCHRHTDMTFEQARAPDDMLFPDIAKSRIFRCTCGSTKANIRPIWPKVGPGGMPLDWGKS